MYLTLDDTKKHGDLPSLLSHLLDNNVDHFEYQQPDEYRLSEQLALFCNKLNKKNITFSCVDSFHFYLPHNELTQHFKTDTNN